MTDENTPERTLIARDRPVATRGRPASRRAGWLVPTSLIVLGFVPLVAGVIRLTELAIGVAITPQNARFFASPVPVVLHIIGVSFYTMLGAFQFVPKFRRRRPGWHRIAGRSLVVCGLVAGLTGLWMTLFYPRAEGDGDLLTAFRIVFGTAMVLSVVLGLAAALRRDFVHHRAWMIRGYAIGMGAGTQVVLFLLIGASGEIPRALLMGAGWVVNVAFAEWIIRRRVAGKAATIRRRVKLWRSRRG